MQTLGILIIVGVLLWIFIVTLPFLWWLWALVFGIVIYMIGISRKEERKKQKEFEKTVKDFGKEENTDMRNLG